VDRVVDRLPAVFDLALTRLSLGNFPEILKKCLLFSLLTFQILLDLIVKNVRLSVRSRVTPECCVQLIVESPINFQLRWESAAA
jgi:hypothetical protein